MSVIASAHGVVPEQCVTQAEVTAALGDLVLRDAPQRRALLERVHASAHVTTRHLALPLDAYAGLNGFTEANDVFIDVGTRLAERAVRGALDAAGLAPADVDQVTSVSVTGIAAPSLDARLVPLLGLRPDVKRVPVFGLGCVAGAAGVARVHDYLLGHPDDVAVLLSVELCSLTLQRGDSSPAALVASGLFGDGAAAVVMVGAERARALGLDGPRVEATRSRLYPDTERVMGWDIGTGGFSIVLSAEVPAVVEQYLRADVDAFLADHGTALADVARVVAHPGGPKVLRAMERALERPEADFAVTWDLLAEQGNLSSASVLHVLERTMAEHPGAPGEAGLMLAMGPGFCLEQVLLRW
ncbi:3-oxoacyl-[acyl-carrier-protein] synthase III C-terminal domain-containing protein [Phycicoccus sp.]|uniref:type III polyketide synthase n=1 Tax=Phycicoccus sp. TaxID=1902410 RepID=UPI002C99E701|nr:3-oxoacyl-[acyl-carrier-protein] synthase III C-terminal domain-containing protein [Phycicoccus sp.]HMM96777.1 3-oxoacyl-[acyl-carrier-protein] synthase III C-terminal domain-containing protein [Phycicoccus sp.]